MKELILTLFFGITFLFLVSLMFTGLYMLFSDFEGDNSDHIDD